VWPPPDVSHTKDALAGWSRIIVLESCSTRRQYGRGIGQCAGPRFKYTRPPARRTRSPFPLSSFGHGPESEARTPRRGRFLAKRCCTFTRPGRRRSASCYRTCRRQTSTLRYICHSLVLSPPAAAVRQRAVAPADMPRANVSPQPKNEASASVHYPAGPPMMACV